MLVWLLTGVLLVAVLVFLLPRAVLDLSLHLLIFIGHTSTCLGVIKHRKTSVISESCEFAVNRAYSVDEVASLKRVAEKLCQ